MCVSGIYFAPIIILFHMCIIFLLFRIRFAFVIVVQCVTLFVRFCVYRTKKFSHKINLSLSFVLFYIYIYIFFCACHVMTHRPCRHVFLCVFVVLIEISTTYPVQRTNSTLSPCLARIAVVADSNKLHGLSQ